MIWHESESVNSPKTNEPNEGDPADLVLRVNVSNIMEWMNELIE